MVHNPGSAQEVDARAEWTSVSRGLDLRYVPIDLVAAEALARGTPVIASDAGGPAEIVDDGSTGWIVETGNETALADAIREALRDRESSVAMGRTGITVATERYDENAWNDRYLDVYGQLLNSKPAQRHT